MKFSCLLSLLCLMTLFNCKESRAQHNPSGLTLKGNRFLNFNTIIRVNEIEVVRQSFRCL